MKKNKAFNASTYVFQNGEHVLVDANIWLYLQPPAAQPPPAFAASYSGAFAKLLAAKAQPIVDSLVLSEYLNRFLRLEYGASWTGAYCNFKQFRTSTDFAPVANAAVAGAKQILMLAATRDTPLTLNDLPSILGETQAGTLDFNDGVLVDTCRLRGWKLLTNDGDMTLGGINVITTNKKLLAACP